MTDAGEIKTEPEPDAPEHAPESGEPLEIGRSPGHPQSEASSNSPEPGENEHWESGRQKAIE